MEKLLFSMDYSIMGSYCHFLGKLLYLGRPQDRIFRFYGGMWRSLVAHFVRDEGAAGSNPVIPIVHLCGVFTFFFVARFQILGVYQFDSVIR